MFEFLLIRNIRIWILVIILLTRLVSQYIPEGIALYRFSIVMHIGFLDIPCGYILEY